MAKNTKDYLEEYINKKDFEYDVFKDPIYLALKKSYEDNAKRTAEDLLGKYSQISGGGSVSSAAMSAASGAAASEMSKLSGHIPELYELARQMYDDELAANQKKFQAMLDYDKYLLQFANKESDKSKDTAEKEEPEPPMDDGTVPEVDGPDVEEDKLPPIVEKDEYSEAGNGITTGSLAAERVSRHVMDPAVYTMTKRLVTTYMSAGQKKQAQELYSKFKAAMSSSQRLEMEKLLGK